MESEDFDAQFWDLFSMDETDGDPEFQFVGADDLQKQYFAMLQNRQDMEIATHAAMVASINSQIVLRCAIALFVFSANLLGAAWSIWYWIK